MGAGGRVMVIRSRHTKRGGVTHHNAMSRRGLIPDALDFGRGGHL